MKHIDTHDTNYSEKAKSPDQTARTSDIGQIRIRGFGFHRCREHSENILEISRSTVEMKQAPLVLSTRSK
jgi:hypothetical protein